MKPRVVFKVGTAILVKNGKLELERIEALCQFFSVIREKYSVMLVTSGAVAAGYSSVKLDKSTMANRQALAAVGQPILMNIYIQILAKYNIVPAQLLLSAYAFDSRKRTETIRGALDVLLEQEVLPIINENDVTATQELEVMDSFGDNDRLSASVAYYFNADLLVILSDIEGYYDKNPTQFSDAKVRKIVKYLTKEELETPLNPNDAFATGGIATKLQAADFLLQHNKKMFLTSGMNLEFARSFLMDGKHISGTLFSRE